MRRRVTILLILTLCSGCATFTPQPLLLCNDYPLAGCHSEPDKEPWEEDARLALVGAAALFVSAGIVLWVIRAHAESTLAAATTPPPEPEPTPENAPLPAPIVTPGDR